MGVLQHHDSITGTEKAHVANDYARILTAALKTVETATSFGLKWVEINLCALLDY